MPGQDTSRRGSDGSQDRFDQAPHIGLPKGGGAVSGIGESFTANPVNGTGTLRVPIATSPGRTGSTPQLALTYNSGSGNGPFGMGWELSLPEITRRTDRGLPQYRDAQESDIFILSGSEDLVRILVKDPQESADGYDIVGYRPRVEGLFARIERWTRQSDGDTHWRTISRDNITTLYGTSPATRVADPNDPARIFSWLIASSQDDKGNVIAYEYAFEDSSNLDLTQSNERNRTPIARSAGRYVKRIKYGNLPSTLVQPDITQLSWLFEVVFDYGEGHYQAQPADAQGRVFVTASTAATQPWPARQDPFSRYRSGFEVRTYRLCRRVLVFHHFPDELGTPDSLVSATELTYQETPVATFLTAVTQSGFVRQQDSTLLRGALPPLELEYSQAHVHSEVHDVAADSLANLPAGVDGGRYRWLDLDGEGTQGVLAEQDDAWYYKRNLTPISLAFDRTRHGPPLPRFEASSEVARLPGLAQPLAPSHRFLDLAREGRLDCVVLGQPGSGFYRRTGRGWDPFRALAHQPNVDWANRNLRFIDVDGDGFSDVLVTENQAFTYYPSLARAGFGAPTRVPKATDEEHGPAVVFADAEQTIFLADMSGDGLADIVRIRNGEVCYWPNLGYGWFGRKVDMDNAPWFDAVDEFDPRRIRLADVDGSGVTDIVYLARYGVSVYFNQSGNAWDGPRRVADFPPVDDLTSIEALDLLGNGTSCLVWTSSQSGDAGRSMRYIDLLGREKPYLLVRIRNNLGAETRLSYAPSTAFYLADRAAGRPWATRIPFPVQVVERVETLDWVSRNRFVARYAYHHGYFDGTEREFRGFGMVERWDTEELGALTTTGVFPNATNIDAASYVPPVLTKTWYHTGAYPMGPRVSRIYDSEFFVEPGLTGDQARAMLLSDSALDDGLTGEEIREAIRSLKGGILRQEDYALDGTEAASLPYSVSERNYTVRMLQPFGGNRHAVFFTHARESIDFQYERTLYTVGGRKVADPRTTHAMTLAVDDYGNEQQSASIAYGRRNDDPDPHLSPNDRAVQRALHATYTQNAYTNSIDEPDAYRTPLLADTCTYELIKVAPKATTPGITNLFLFAEMASAIAQAADGLHDLPYEDVNASGATQDHPYRRPIEHSRTLYRKDDLTAGLALQTVESLALPFARYKLAFTPGLLALYQRGTEDLLPTPITTLRDGGGYVLGDDQKALGLFPSTDASGQWWVPSGRVFYSPGAGDTPAQELATARSNLFLPARFRDLFGNDTIATYDPHALLLTQVRDPVGNVVASSNDYRVLKPALVTDPNGNRSAAAFDALGLLAGTAVMGKSSESLGDSLAGFAADLTQTQIDAFFANPKGPASAALLGNATTRVVYDLGRFARAPSTPASPAPAYSATIARETHVSDLAQGQTSRLQVGLCYSDGFGREIQRKGQCEPGPVVSGGPNVDPRWVATGWTIFNNKGKPVRQYEPFFTATHDFEFGVTVGVSPVLFYDPTGRVVATLQPNQSWAKTTFDPWRQVTWDANDTVAIADPSADADVGPYFARLPAASYLPTWYAQRAAGGLGPQEQDAATKAAIHANTPATRYFEAMGRTFLALAFNRSMSGGSPVESHDRALSEVDIEGNVRSITDALGRTVMTYDYDMLGTRFHTTSVDAGERWSLNDAGGKAYVAWDSRAHRLQYTYDAARRPTGLLVQTGSATPQLAEKTVYGEGQPSAAQDQAMNLRGKVYQQFDAAGVVTNSQYDFKGNLLNGSRELLNDYQDAVDWSTAQTLTGETFSTSSTFDALNRPVTMVAPDASVIRPAFDQASLLQQIAVNLQGAATATTFVSNIVYNAKAQRVLIAYGNGAQTSYAYDPLTFRLSNLTTTRSSGGATLQALGYTYDPVGNITHISDGAQQTVYFNNAVVDPSTDYLYDALYRLIQATGRELIGLASQPQTTWDDTPRMGQPLPTDAQAMRTYTESYQYDSVGNVLSVNHTAAAGTWSRTYAYDEPNVPPTNNRLTSTTVGATKEQPYTYDPHGNMTAMPHLPVMTWDFKDQLHSTQQQVMNTGPAATTYYVYDAKGQRVRKVNRSASGTTLNERIYLGGYEVYREYDASGTVTLERDTLHVMDDKRRVALVETKVLDSGAQEGTLPETVIRYQCSNLLESACLELDENAVVLSYEEFYPYGSTSYQSGPSAAEVSLKRYRFTGRERDTENGFYYHGARYYAAWLGRWTSCDPVMAADGPNPYAYVRSNPVRLNDPTGTQASDDAINPAPATGPAQPSLDEARATPPKSYHWGGKLQDTPPPGRAVTPHDSPAPPVANPGNAAPQAPQAPTPPTEAWKPPEPPKPHLILLTWTNGPEGVAPGRFEREAFAQGTGSLTRSSAGRSGVTGGLGSAQAAGRYGLGAVPGIGANADVGLVLGGSTTTSPEGASRGWQAGLTAHVGDAPDDPGKWGFGAYANATASVIQPGSTDPSFAVSGTLVAENKLSKSTTLDINLAGGGTGPTQTNSGVSLKNSAWGQGLVSISQSWNKESDTFGAELRFDYARGAAQPDSGSAAPDATALRGGVGASYTHQVWTANGPGALLGVGVNLLGESTAVAPTATSPAIHTTNAAVFLNLGLGFVSF
jgi:RHS repeat-associated protein